MSDKICDISEFNSITDWEKVYKNVDGLIIRMGLRGSILGTPGCGKIRYDKKFDSFVSAAKSYGIPYRIYFFPTSISEVEAAEEGAFIQSVVNKYSIKSPVWLDSEMVNDGKGRADKLSKADRTKYLKIIVDHLKTCGIQCGIYASTNWLGSHLDMSQFDAETRDLTWVAEYNSKCNYSGPYAMWQYTSSGQVPGIKGTKNGVDLSHDYAEIFTITAGGNSTMEKTNTGLLDYAKAQIGLPYWMGTFGQIATDALYRQKKKQLPAYYTASDFKSQYGKRVHDCVGLIKGYLWSDTPTSTPKYNASQDVSAAGMYSVSEDRGNIASIPNIPGILVYKGSTPSKIYHIGVYGADGYVYEAKGHAYGVVKTKFKSGEWQYWSKCKFIKYVESETTDDNAASTTESTEKLSKTDTEAIKVILGKYGNGDTRKRALGANYTVIQGRVNALLKDHTLLIEKMAQFVIADYAGKGTARKEYLRNYYAEVQKKVNELLK